MMEKSINKWKWAFFISTALLISAVAFLLYAVMDQGVTITYMSQGYGDTEKDLERLAKVFPKDVYSKKDIVYLLRREYPEAFIVERKCTVQLRRLRFEFSETGKLIDINTKAESSPEYECGGT
ncbi:hypothetical protein [Methylobacter tundripaludum]|uniref:hypothetical protein n=1 Tax=Methylobacter tundripaludum TaxID=173365 RepID=UPI0011B0B3EB|nr:hypothetical protein [Methylobacter tundripaludum]